MMCDYKVTENDCSVILRKHLKHNDFEILHYEEKSLANDVFGIMAGHYNLHITAIVKNVNVAYKFFMKRMHAALEIQNKMIQMQGAYEKEAFMYEFFDKVVQIEPKYKLDITANCFFTVKNDMFILEDLCEDGYIANKAGDYQLDLEQYVHALDSIAKFHAASIIYETKRSISKPYKLTDEFSEFLKEPLYRDDENYLGNKLLKSSVTAVLAIMDVMPHLKNKEEIKMKFQYHADRIYDLVKPSDKYRNVICHGDLWSNNLLFRYIEDRPVHCKLIDFQALRYTVPAHDVVSLVYVSMNQTFLDDHKNELYLSYYKALQKHLAECGIDINEQLTLKELEETATDVLPFVVVEKIIMMLTIILTFDERSKTDQDYFEQLMYGDKTKICVDFYQSNQYFKLCVDQAVAKLNEF